MGPYELDTRRGTFIIDRHFNTVEEAVNNGYDLLFTDDAYGLIYSKVGNDNDTSFARISATHRYKVPCVWQMSGYIYVDATSKIEAIDAALKKGFCIDQVVNSHYVEDSFGVDLKVEPVDITIEKLQKYAVTSCTEVNGTKIISTSYLSATSRADAYEKAKEVLPENSKIGFVRRVHEIAAERVNEITAE